MHTAVRVPQMTSNRVSNTEKGKKMAEAQPGTGKAYYCPLSGGEKASVAEARLAG